MAEHTLKCWPGMFARVASGDKTFEVRKNDRHFQCGDTVVLCEWDPSTQLFSGERMTKFVGFVLRSGFGVDLGEHVVFSLLDGPPHG